MTPQTNGRFGVAEEQKLRKVIPNNRQLIKNNPSILSGQ
jgi:hypothetical protein